MIPIARLSITCLSVVAFVRAASDGSVEVKPTKTDVVPTHTEPQVAMVCDEKNMLVNKIMDKNGEWIDDITYQESCLSSKGDILDYCKKVYPEKDITNIVESIKTYRLKNWCKKGRSKKCKGSYHWVKPFRCLQGAFQSEALLVPRKCQFDHLHNNSHCWNFDRWNVSAIDACENHGMSLRSFSVLIPCGLDLWEGVEFVCCPKDGKKVVSDKKAALKKPLSLKNDDEKLENPIDLDDDDDESDENDDDDDEDESDEFDDSDEEEDDVEDMYLKKVDPREEHAAFLAAKERLQRSREKSINRIMMAWSKMEEKVKELAKTNPKSAEQYRSEMTSALRKEVSAIEAEHEQKKKRLVDTHQQRVLKTIAERKPEAEKCFMDALREETINSRKVEKCLQKLLRSLHKERHHYLSHYRHLLLIQPTEAHAVRQLTLGRLVENDLTVNKSLNLLRTKGGRTGQKLYPLMQQYADALRTKDASPMEDLAHVNLLSRTRETEEGILKAYEEEADAKKVRDERIAAMKREQNGENKEEEIAANEVHTGIVRVKDFPTNDLNDIEDDPIILPPPKTAIEGVEAIHDVSQTIDEEPIVAHAMAHSISHDTPDFKMIEEEFKVEKEGQSVLLAVLFAGITLTVVIAVSVAITRRRNGQGDRRNKRGFTAVEQAATPEEKHVAVMQINGYENPTYKFFEEEE